MKKLIFLTALITVTSNVLAQTPDFYNPKGKFYFGVELGYNKNKSFYPNENSFQSGIKAEYYFTKHWAIQSGVKYYEIGVSYYDLYTKSDLSTVFVSSSFNKEPTYDFGSFKGNVIAIPLSIKWEFGPRKIKGSLKLGTNYTIETKSEYGDYSSTNSINFSKKYWNINAGYAIEYYINKNCAVYLESEIILGTTKKGSIATSNQLTSIGFKYTFKKG